jgi:HPt (histidine-containing phosphotransfer) domain-containing protein
MKKNSLIKKISKIAGGKKKVEKQLIEIIYRQTSLLLKQMEDSLKKADWIELKRLAHKIQSTFAILKMQRAKELAEAIRTNSGIKIRATKKETIELIEICKEMLADLNLNVKN